MRGAAAAEAVVAALTDGAGVPAGLVEDAGVPAGLVEDAGADAAGAPLAIVLTAVVETPPSNAI